MDTAVEQYILIDGECLKGPVVAILGIERTCEKVRRTRMIGFNGRKFLKRYPLMQRDVGPISEDAWRSSDAIEVWAFSVRVLSEFSSHFNFDYKSCGLDVGRVR